MFREGQPSKSYPRPKSFDFGNRASSGFFSVWYDRRQGIFVNLCHIVIVKGKTVNLKSRSILTKYSNRLTDKPLSKHYRVNIDLDGLKKPRNARMTQRFNQRVSILSLCCYHRQETFVNLGLFEIINYSSFLCLCLVTAFYSISFL